MRWNGTKNFIFKRLLSAFVAVVLLLASLPADAVALAVQELSERGQVDLTQRMEEVSVRLEGWWYEDSKGEKQPLFAEEEEAEERDGKEAPKGESASKPEKPEDSSQKDETETEERLPVSVDLSTVPADVVKKSKKTVKMGFTLHYSLLKEGEERDVQPGDYLRFAFPQQFSKLTIEDAVLYSVAEAEEPEELEVREASEGKEAKETKEAKEDEVAEEVPEVETAIPDAVRWTIDRESDPITGKKLTDKELEKTRLTGLFLTDVVEERVSGQVELSFELTKEELEEAGRESVEMLLQGKKKDKNALRYEFIFPVKEAEPEQEKAPVEEQKRPLPDVKEPAEPVQPEEEALPEQSAQPEEEATEEAPQEEQESEPVREPEEEYSEEEPAIVTAAIDEGEEGNEEEMDEESFLAMLSQLFKLRPMSDPGTAPGPDPDGSGSGPDPTPVDPFAGLSEVTDKKYSVQENTVTVVWNDNNDNDKGRPTDAALDWYKDHVSFTYTKYRAKRVENPDGTYSYVKVMRVDNGDGTYSYVDGEEALETGPYPGLPTDITPDNGSEWSYSYGNLPMVYYKEENDETEFYIVEYDVKQTKTPDGYIEQTNEVNDLIAANQRPSTVPEYGKILFNTYTCKFEATVNWNDGSGSYGTRPNTEDYEDKLELIRYQAGSSPNDTSAAGYQKLDNATKEVLEVSKKSDSSLTVKSGELPAYSLEGAQYRYCVKQKELETVNPSFDPSLTASYTPLYDNSNNNYTNITNLLYSEGELTNTLTAETQLTFTHIWKDGEQSEAEREGASHIYLYRVAESDGVAELEDSPVSGVINTMNTPTEKEATFYFGSEAERYPVFDANGNRYVYYIRENTTKDVYKTYLIDQAGNLYDGITIVDDKGNYILNSGKYQTTLEKKTYVTATKEYRIAAVQDINKPEIENSLTEVVLALQYTSERYGDNKNDHWKYYDVIIDTDGDLCFEGEKLYHKVDGEYIPYKNVIGWPKRLVPCDKDGTANPAGQYLYAIEEDRPGQKIVTFQLIKENTYRRVSLLKDFALEKHSASEELEVAMYDSEGYPMEYRFKEIALSVMSRDAFSDPEDMDGFEGDLVIPSLDKGATAPGVGSQKTLAKIRSTIAEDGTVINVLVGDTHVELEKTFRDYAEGAPRDSWAEITLFRNDVAMTVANKDKFGDAVFVENVDGQEVLYVKTSYYDLCKVTSRVKSEKGFFYEKLANYDDTKTPEQNETDGNARIHEQVMEKSGIYYGKLEGYDETKTPEQNVADGKAVVCAYPSVVRIEADEEAFTQKTGEMNKYDSQVYDYYEATRSFVYEYLPRYDSDGKEYDYTVVETGMSSGYYLRGVEYDRSVKEDYNPDESDQEYEKLLYQKAHVLNDNTPPGQKSIYINVEKRWLDGGNLQSRKPVTVSLIKIAGGEVKVNGEPCNVGDVATSVVLNEENNWQSLVWFTTDNMSEGASNYVAMETAVGGVPTEYSLPDIDHDGKRDPEDYQYILQRNILQKMQGSDKTVLDGLNDQQKFEEDYRVGTVGYTDPTNKLNHYYNIYTGLTTDKGDGIPYYTIYNQRVGTLRFQVTKQWKDGGNGLAAKLAVYRATDDETNPYVQVDANLYNSGTAGGGADPNQATLELGAGTVNSSEQHYYAVLDRPGGEEITTSRTWSSDNYPKYDKYGNVYKYLVREPQLVSDTNPRQAVFSTYSDVDNGIPSEYIENTGMGLDGTAYEISTSHEIAYGPHNSDDLYHYGISNRKRQYYHLNVNVVWRDNGTKDSVYGKNDYARPDISLKVYRTTVSALKAVAGLGVTDHDSALDLLQDITPAQLRALIDGETIEQTSNTSGAWDTTTGGEWYWHCDLGEVSRYSSDGEPYIYFASEKLSGNAASYDKIYYNSVNGYSFAGGTVADYRPVSGSIVNGVYEKETAATNTVESFVPNPQVNNQGVYLPSEDKWSTTRENWGKTMVILNDGTLEIPLDSEMNNDERMEEIQNYFSATIVNYIKGTQKVEGHKVWMLSNGNYLSNANQPKVGMKLYVSYRADQTKLAELEGAEIGATIAESSSNFNFRFPDDDMVYLDEAAYNSSTAEKRLKKTVKLTLNGQSYQVNLQTTKGGADILPMQDQWGRKLHYYVTEDNGSINEVYFNTNYDYPGTVTSGDFVVSNIYQINRTEGRHDYVEVHAWKEWEEGCLRTPDAKTTFQLIASYGGKEEVVSKAILSGTETEIVFSELNVPTSQLYIKPSENGGKFAKIPYFAPNGQPYTFTVREVLPNGYTSNKETHAVAEKPVSYAQATVTARDEEMLQQGVYTLYAQWQMKLVGKDGGYDGGYAPTGEPFPVAEVTVTDDTTKSITFKRVTVDGVTDTNFVKDSLIPLFQDEEETPYRFTVKDKTYVDCHLDVTSVSGTHVSAKATVTNQNGGMLEAGIYTLYAQMQDESSYPIGEPVAIARTTGDGTQDEIVFETVTLDDTSDIGMTKDAPIPLKDSEGRPYLFTVEGRRTYPDNVNLNYSVEVTNVAGEVYRTFEIAKGDAFKNKFTPGEQKLIVSKKWNDFSNLMKTRPESLSYTIEARVGGEKKPGTDEDADPAFTIDVTLEKDSDGKVKVDQAKIILKAGGSSYSYLDVDENARSVLVGKKNDVGEITSGREYSITADSVEDPYTGNELLNKLISFFLGSPKVDYTSNQWNLEVLKLPRYTPDSKEFVYKVVENRDESLVLYEPVQPAEAEKTATSGQVKAELNNDLKMGKLTLTKTMLMKLDGSSESVAMAQTELEHLLALHEIPEELNFEVEYRFSDSEDWKSIECTTNHVPNEDPVKPHSPTPGTYITVDDKEVLGGTLKTIDILQPGKNTLSWVLPVWYQEGKQIQYRVREPGMESTFELSFTGNDESLTGNSGVFIQEPDPDPDNPGKEIKTEDRTASYSISNTMTTVKLRLSKYWVDKNNEDKTRPQNLELDVIHYDPEVHKDYKTKLTLTQDPANPNRYASEELYLPRPEIDVEKGSMSETEYTEAVKAAMEAALTEHYAVKEAALTTDGNLDSYKLIAWQRNNDSTKEAVATSAETVTQTIDEEDKEFYTITLDKPVFEKVGNTNLYECALTNATEWDDEVAAGEGALPAPDDEMPVPPPLVGPDFDYAPKLTTLTTRKSFVGDEDWKSLTRPTTIGFELFYRKKVEAGEPMAWQSVSTIKDVKNLIKATDLRKTNFPDGQAAVKYVTVNQTDTEYTVPDWTVYRYWWPTSETDATAEMEYAVQETVYRSGFDPATGNPDAYKLYTTLLTADPYAKNNSGYVVEEEDFEELTFSLTYETDQKNGTGEATVTNTMRKAPVTIPLKKQWSGLPGGLTKTQLTTLIEQGTIPETLTFQMQCSVDNGTSWATLKKGEEPNVTTFETTVNTIDFFKEADNTWTLSQDWTVADLPVRASNGNEIKYRAVEIGCKYAVTYSGKNSYTMPSVSAEGDTFKNTVKLASLSVTKLWQDEDNRDGVRPQNITLRLNRDGVTYHEVTLGNEAVSGQFLYEITKTDNNQFVVTWKNLPVYKNDGSGEKSHYTVKELSEGGSTVEDGQKVDANYQVTYSNTGASVLPESGDDRNQDHGTITNTYVPERISVMVHKAWDTTNKTNDPMFNDSDSSQLNFVLQYRMDGDEDWTDVTKKALDSLNLYLDGNGVYTTVEPTQTADKAHGWELIWTNLPRRLNKDYIYYRVLEKDAVTGFTTVYTDAGEVGLSAEQTAKNGTQTQTITNTLELTQISLSKRWSTGWESERPGSIVIEVQRSINGTSWSDFSTTDGKCTDGKVTLNSGNGWSVDLVDLPKYDTIKKQPYQYRFREAVRMTEGGDPVYTEWAEVGQTKNSGNTQSYKEQITVTKDDGYNVEAVNTLVTGSLSVTKLWQDEDDRDRVRPGSITLRLKRDGETYMEVTLGKEPVDTSLYQITKNNNNEFVVTWKNLPVYRKNSKVKSKYTVEELKDGSPVADNGSIGNYQVTYSNTGASEIPEEGANKDHGTIRNTHVPERISVKVQKVWERGNTADTMFGDVGSSQLHFVLQYRVGTSGEWTSVTQSGQDSFDLYPDGNGVYTSLEPTLIAKRAGGWELTWTNLPRKKLDGDGNCYIYYRVLEQDAITGYSTVYTTAGANGLSSEQTAAGGTQVQTITNTPDKTQISLSKSWSEGWESERPDEVVIEVQRSIDRTSWSDFSTTDGKCTDGKVTLNSDNHWSVVLDNLPKYDTINKELYQYRFRESVTMTEGGDPVYTEWALADEANKTKTSGDEQSYKEQITVTKDTGENYTVEAENTLVTGSLSVHKAWDDDSNRDGEQPSAVVVTLKRDGVPYGEPVTLNSGNGWSYTWTNLPVYQKNSKTESKYQVVETAVGTYTTTYAYSPGNGGSGDTVQLVKNAGGQFTQSCTVTNTHDPYLFQIDGTKIWEGDDVLDDDENRAAARNGLQLTLEYSSDGGSTWHDVAEAASTSVADRTDPHVVYTTSGVTQTAVGTANVTQWTASWANVNEFVLNDSGESVQAKFRLREETFAGEIYYTAAASTTTISQNDHQADEDPGELSITNTLKKTQISVSKRWENEVVTERPGSVEILVERLQKDGSGDVWVAYRTVTLNSGNSWADTLTNLPKYDPVNNREYQYRFSEKVTLRNDEGTICTPWAEASQTQTSGDEQSYKEQITVTKDSEWNYTVQAVNTLVTGSLSVHKAWDDDSNRDGERPTEVEVTLYRDDAQYGTSVKLNSGNGWSYTWTNLPVYQVNSKTKSQYRVEEKAVDTYTTTYSGTVQLTKNAEQKFTGSCTVTNTHIPYLFQIDGKKIWEGDSTFTKRATARNGLQLTLEYSSDGGTTWNPVVYAASATARSNPHVVYTTSEVTKAVTGVADDTEWTASWLDVNEFVLNGDVSTQALFRLRETFAGQVYYRTASVTTTTGNKENHTSDTSPGSLTITNSVIRVKVEKHDANGLITATETTFELYVDGKTGKIATLTTQDGVLTLNYDTVGMDFQSGKSYTLKEVTPPEGYKVAEPFRFTVNSDGTITDLNTNATITNPTDWTTQLPTIRVQDPHITLSLVKTDLAGHELNSDGNDHYRGYAEFTVTPESESESKFTTGAAAIEGVTADNIDQKLTGKLIARNSYVFTETKAPDGYEKPSQTFTITVSDDGKSISEKTDAGELVTVSGLSMTVKNSPIEVSLVKVGEATPADPLAGAIFTIEPKAGTSSAFAKTAETEDVTSSRTLPTSGADGVVRIPSAMLISGNTYVIKEDTAPAGYKCGPDVEIYVNEDGTITYNSENQGESLTIPNEKIRLTIIKTNENGTERLNGVEFELRPDAGSAFAIAQTDNVLKLTTAHIDDEDGKIKVPEGVLKHSNYYTLTETKTNNTYQLGDGTSLKFYVEKNGKITLKQSSKLSSGEAVYSVDNINAISVVTAKNELTRLTVTKHWNDDNDRDGKRPTSVTVQLKRDGENHRDPVTLNEGNQWTHTWEGLEVYRPDGVTPYVYTVEETDLPTSYLVSYSTGQDLTGRGTKTLTMTNTQTTNPDLLTIPFQKKWTEEEAGDRENLRPKTLTFRLKCEEKVIQEITLTAPADEDSTDKNLWKGEFTVIPPKYDANGDEIVYWVEEVYNGHGSDSGPVIPGYTLDSLTSDPVEGYVMTNRRTPGEITVRKYGAGETDPLKDVKFVLYDMDDNMVGGEPKFTDNEGEIVYEKLAEGNYSLVEANTADGYTLLPAPVNITIPLALSEEEAEAWGADLTGDGVWHDERNHKYYFYELTYKITNSQGFDMPASGGGGAVNRILSLTALVGLLGGVYYLLFSRKSSDEGPDSG